MSRTNLIIILSSIFLLVFVLELLRRRKLREEYSWLWLITSIIYLVIAIWPSPSEWVANFIGVTSPAITFAFLGINFIILILIQFSVRLSRLTTQIKNLTQEVTILDAEIKKNSDELVIFSSGEPGMERKKLIEQQSQIEEKIEDLKRELSELNTNLMRG